MLNNLSWFVILFMIVQFMLSFSTISFLLSSLYIALHTFFFKNDFLLKIIYALVEGEQINLFLTSMLLSSKRGRMLSPPCFDDTNEQTKT